MNNHHAKGFSLLELIMVIIILGILSSTALPKMIDLVYDANKSFDKSVAAAITQWGLVNFMATKLDDSDAFSISATDNACSGNTASVASARASILIGDVQLMSNQTPKNTNEYLIKTDATQFGANSFTCDAAGKTITCIIESKDGNKTPFYIPCTN